VQRLRTDPGMAFQCRSPGVTTQAIFVGVAANSLV
jgi:hypothetical protein